jgi:hypothetical protein
MRNQIAAIVAASAIAVTAAACGSAAAAPAKPRPHVLYSASGNGSGVRMMPSRAPQKVTVRYSYTCPATGQCDFVAGLGPQPNIGNVTFIDQERGDGISGSYSKTLRLPRADTQGYMLAVLAEGPWTIQVWSAP